MDTLNKLMEISIQRQFLIIKTKKNKTKNEELWSKVKYLMRSITKNSDDYDGKYIKTKFNPDDELPLNKWI